HRSRARSYAAAAAETCRPAICTSSGRALPSRSAVARLIGSGESAISRGGAVSASGLFPEASDAGGSGTPGAGGRAGCSARPPAPRPRDTMLHTRTRPLSAALLAALCLLFPGTGRPDEKGKLAAPPTREEIRKELEAKLAGRSPDEILAVVNQLAGEWPARK